MIKEIPEIYPSPKFGE